MENEGPTIFEKWGATDAGERELKSRRPGKDAGSEARKKCGNERLRTQQGSRPIARSTS